VRAKDGFYQPRLAPARLRPDDLPTFKRIGLDRQQFVSAGVSRLDEKQRAGDRPAEHGQQQHDADDAVKEPGGHAASMVTRRV
jgi:hypothetical protein